MRPAYALQTDFTAGGTTFAGNTVPPESTRDSLVSSLREHLARMPTGWDVGVLSGSFDGRVVLFTRLTRATTPTLLAFATDSATLREFVMRPVLCNTRLVTTSRDSTGISNDSLVALRVTDGSGVSLYETGPRVDATLAGESRFPVEWGELTVTASFRPRAAALVMPGGVPRSPVPMLALLLVTAATLVGIAGLMIWRTHQLDRLRADFTSSVSHELRTPLTQILLYAETIEMGRQRSREKRTEAIGVITRETRRMIHLVENVLHFSRAERGLTRLRLQPRELGEIVAETIDAFAPVAESRGVTVSLRLAEPLYARVDADAVRRILLNLLDNAVRYGPAGQRVTVGAERGGSWTRLIVQDEGPGIPADRREDIWRPFVRLDDPTADSVTGCGIGLAIVSELVELHGGRRRVESGEGAGAAFVVELPGAPSPIGAMSGRSRASDAAGSALGVGAE